VRIDVQCSKLSGGKKYRNAAQVGTDREPTASSVIQLLPPMQDARRLVSAENAADAFIIKCDSVDCLRDIASVLNDLTMIISQGNWCDHPMN
jgi:hypothetical protein